MPGKGSVELTFKLVNRDCKVAKTLRTNGIEEFRIIGLRPIENSIRHVVEIREGPNTKIMMVDSEGCDLCKLLSSEGTFLISARMKNDNMRCQVVVRDRQASRRMISKLKTFPGFKLLAMRGGGSMLTSRQEEVLLTALRMGYFDIPRRIKTRELASVLGMKPSTLTEILRRALRKLIVEHYGEIAVRNHDSI